MTRHYFLGAAANQKKAFSWLFSGGSRRDVEKLEKYLSERYSGEAILMKNGRSALATALKCYFKPGDKIIVNGFTCFAVIEAIFASGLKPVYADISTKDLNFDVKNLEDCLSRTKGIRGIIIQNTFGNPVQIKAVERFAKKNELILIEDLAHSAGVVYPDGREAGTVGAATILSFGKEKAIDTVSGGAVILRDFETINGARFKLPRNARKTWVQELRPTKGTRKSDSLRARYYPLFGKIYRGLSYVRLNGIFMRFLLAVHFVEKSADNKLDLRRRPADFMAKRALKQIKKLENSGVLREFYLVNNRDEVLEKLRKAGYYFDGFWYETPIAPKRYYDKAKFDKKNCPTAVLVAEKIINFPTYYSEKQMKRAREILAEVGDFWNEKGGQK
ncbi:MAG: aminotransferase class I/II-fold pyridoxal phosphate-dependent enzyme [Candidatus Saccharibacteria bacterium]|nr:aminotransferase class I/II-fold pyridoxal phosphate-dependent enzyme [Candidatus Saccharibacteria bacterium]